MQNEINNKDEWIRKFARFGMFAKGTVYILIGGLTAFAAFNAGGKKTGKGGAFEFVMEQPFGKIILGLIAVGLIGYVLWRIVQTIKDPEDEGGLRRLGYAASGIFYGLVAYTAIQMIISGDGGGGSSSQKSMISEILSNPWGQIAVGIIALIFFGKAVWQFYRSLSGKFASKIKESELGHKSKIIVMKAGRAGYIARGVVIAIIGYLFLRAAVTSSSEQAGGTKEAYEVLQNNIAGPVILGIVALGLVAYGIFMFVKGNYRVMPSL